MGYKKGVRNIQAAGYNGARTVLQNTVTTENIRI